MNVGQRLASAAWCTGIENENGTKANRPSDVSRNNCNNYNISKITIANFMF